ncbi:unnamed protein product [Owenia fusiformis]|uniref:HMG box domain-containing protein n=1 Tax=Owenia fusiformis TaxID=6347 RepID=A0A8S4NQ30_OWEFU|nr:unnamed protein product [Owenia fusiformis]
MENELMLKSYNQNDDKQESTPTSSKKKRVKRAKDPNAPKRPTTSYFYFLQQSRAEMKERGENTTKVTEVTKISTEKWRQMTAEDKQPFEEKAKADRERFAVEFSAYKETDGYKSFNFKNNSKRQRDPDKPKKPLGAFFLFMKDFRETPESKDLAFTDIPKRGGEIWSGMEADKKQEYKDRAEELKEEYNQRLIEYSGKKARLELGAGGDADSIEEYTEDSD